MNRHYSLKRDHRVKVIEQETYLNEQTLANIHDHLLKNGDIERANQIIDLFDKLHHHYTFVSFTGHFSAGKSSIINYLLGKELLPKSPIPTSANIVKITSGDGVARVYFHDESPIEYDEPYDIDMIKEYCMNKASIREIEIQTAEPIVPYGSFIVDTPGIDAADDADRYMTESSLHLVDVLFYV